MKNSPLMYSEEDLLPLSALQQSFLAQGVDKKMITAF